MNNIKNGKTLKVFITIKNTKIFIKNLNIVFWPVMTVYSNFINSDKIKVDRPETKLYSYFDSRPKGRVY